MRNMRSSCNFYPQQARAILLTFHPIPTWKQHPSDGTNDTPSPTPTEPAPLSAADEPPVSNTLKRRMRNSNEIIDAMYADSTQAGNLVKMLKTGSWN